MLVLSYMVTARCRLQRCFYVRNLDGTDINVIFLFPNVDSQVLISNIMPVVAGYINELGPYRYINELGSGGCDTIRAFH